MAIARPRDILDFWFAAGPEKWFAKNDAFDAEIRRNFESVRRRFDVEVPETARKWFYMPYMHAEDRAAQERGLICFTTRLHDPETLSFATEHAAIVHRFGRFPHRNAVLGRETTPEERSFLDEGGFTG